jgi:hypothetical protein
MKRFGTMVVRRWDDCYAQSFRSGTRASHTAQARATVVAGLVDWDFKAPAKSQTRPEPRETEGIATDSRDRGTVICRSFVIERVELRLPENRGVPGSSPGLAIGGNACKPAPLSLQFASPV